ncbi:hypothetical protein BC830DRAFT_1116979, partial [Chytriomyces sp. MP71]
MHRYLAWPETEARCWCQEIITPSLAKMATPTKRVEVRSQATEEVYETADPAPLVTRVEVDAALEETGLGALSVDGIDATPLLAMPASHKQRIFGANSSVSVAEKTSSNSSAARFKRRPNASVVREALDHHSRSNMNGQGQGSDHLETPLQTLRRLIFETRELTEDMLDAQHSGPIPSIADSLPPPPSDELLSTARELETSLALLSNPLALSGGGGSAINNPHASSALQQTEIFAALAANIQHAKERQTRNVSPPRSYAAAAAIHSHSSSSHHAHLPGAASPNKVPGTPMGIGPQTAAVSPSMTAMGLGTSPRASASQMVVAGSATGSAFPMPSPVMRAGSIESIGSNVGIHGQNALPSTPAPSIWSNSIQYDLYFQPGNTTFGDDVLELERRIGALERLVGGTATGVSDGSTSLLDEITELDATLTLLTTPHALARLSRRIQTISGQLERTVTLRRRIIQERQRANRRSYLSATSDFDDNSSDSDANGAGDEGGEEEAVNELVEAEMEARRAEDERKVGWLFGCLGDRLDPMATTIPVLLARLKGLKLLNAEVSSQTVREAMAEIENEQNGIIVERFTRVKEGLARIRTGIRKGARGGVERFEGVEKGVRELIEKVEEVCGNVMT